MILVKDFAEYLMVFSKKRDFNRNYKFLTKNTIIQLKQRILCEIYVFVRYDYAPKTTCFHRERFIIKNDEFSTKTTSFQRILRILRVFNENYEC